MRGLTPTVEGAASAQTCCQLVNGAIEICEKCQYDADGNQVGDFYSKTVQTGPISSKPPSTWTALPPSGNNIGGFTNGQTSLPSRLGNALPPSSGNITLHPGSIFKIPPGTTNVQPTTNNTGTFPALTVTKEHNPASPKFNSVGNATGPTNNTSTLKSSPLTVQNPQTSAGHHHHKGGTSSTSNANSTGH